MKKWIAVIATIILTVCTFSACSGCKMESKDISYDGEKIVWDAPMLAEKFDVSINDGEKHTVSTEEFLYTATGDFKVTITVHRKLSFIFKAKTVSKQFKMLPTVDKDTIEYDETAGKFTWDAVDGATAYAVKIGDKEYTATAAEFAYSEAGSFTFAVRAKGSSSSYYSAWSGSYQGRILSAPENVVYNDKEGKISWATVSGASGYTVYINNEEFSTPTNSYVYSTEETFTLSVRANGTAASKVFGSVKSTQIEYVFLPTVTEVFVQDGVITWTDDELNTRATGYYLKVSKNGGSAVIVNNGSPFTERKYAPGEGQYSVQVLPMCSGENIRYFSSWCPSYLIKVLAAPTPVITTSNNDETTITFPSDVNGRIGRLSYSDDGDGYEIVESSIDLSGKSEYKNTYENVGYYKFELKATATDGDSAWSNPIEIVRLGTPGKETINDNMRATDSVTQVTFGKVAGALNYTVYANDVVQTNLNLTSNVFALNAFNEAQMLLDGGECTVKVFAESYVPSGMNGKKICLRSKTPLTFTVTKLAVPKNFRVENGLLKWDASSTANNGYIVAFMKNAAEVARYEVQGGVAQQDLNFIKEAGTYTLNVRALGNGSSVVSSEPTVNKQVTRLATPTGANIAGGYLNWTAVTGALDYDISIGENLSTATTYSTESTATSFDLTSLAKTATQSVTIIAKGNDQDILDSYSSTSPLTFEKLTVAETVTVNNTEIAWSSVPNAKSYGVFVGSMRVTTVEAPTTKLSHSAYITDAGSYTVSVQAYGSNTSSSSTTAYLTGEKSGAVSVIKLTKPTLTTKNGENRVYWNSDAVAFGAASAVEVGTQQYEKTNTYYEMPIVSGSNTKVNVRFIGDGKASLTQTGTVTSDTATLAIELQELKKPTISVTVGTGNATVSVTNTSEYTAVSSYVKWMFNNGSDLPSPIAESSYQYTLNAGASMTVSATAIGGFFMDGDYYVNSTKSDSQTVTALPQVQDVTRTTAGITWTMPGTYSNSVSTYSVTVSYTLGGSPVTETKTSSVASCDIVIPVGATSITVTITANGKSGNIVSSVTTVNLD